MPISTPRGGSLTSGVERSRSRGASTEGRRSEPMAAPRLETVGRVQEENQMIPLTRRPMLSHFHISKTCHLPQAK